MKISKQKNNLVKIYSIIGFVLVLNILFRYNFKIRTKMKKNITEDKIKLLDLLNPIFWGSSHFIMYICLGFYAPDLWYISYTLSVLWEIFEYFLQDIFPYVKFRFSDFIINAIGLLIGILLYRKIKKKNKNKNKN